MKKCLFLLPALLLVIHTVGFSQSDAADYPFGKPFARIYSDFYAGFEDGEYNTAFEVKRAYLGYGSQLSEHFYARVNLDIGSPNDQSQYALLRRYAYFKNAYLEYQNGRVKINFGIIPIYHFKIQEKTWGHRYLYKSINDAHGLGFTADLGTSVQYRISNAVTADLSITNGEGYTKLQSDDKYKVGTGVTGVFDNGVMFRLYGDFSRDELIQSTLSSFLGYNFMKKGVAGVEWNIKLNDNFQSAHHRTAISVYGSWDFNPQWQVFGRYDRVYGNIVGDELIPYSLSDDGTAIIGGIQYSPVKYVKIAINYQDWYPMAANTGNMNALYLNLEIKL
jgi:hypothetical protein